MKRFASVGLTLFAFLLLFAGSAAAQGNNVTGQVIGLDGNPLPNATITIKNDTGRTFTTKTDSKGNFIQVGVPDGVYTVSLTSPAVPQGFTTQFQASGSNNQPWNINLKEIAAASGGSEKAAAEKEAFNNMKQHFDAATTAMNDADAIKKQLATAPADQKSDLTSKMNAAYQTALTEYTAAEQGVNAKDTGNHALIWASIGRADDATSKYADAATAYQKAIDLKPTADYYSDLSTALTNVAASQHDPDLMNAAYQTALTEYTAAEQGVNAKDTGNHALIWASIGRADDATSKYADAATAYQKAIDLKPTADYYSDLSTALTNVAASQHDPAVLQQK